MFVATVDNGEYLRDCYGAPEPEGEEPLTGTSVSQALKRCVAKADLDPDSISLHWLRHLGAELFQQASGDVRQTQLFLDHAHLNGCPRGSGELRRRTAENRLTLLWPCNRSYIT